MLYINHLFDQAGGEYAADCFIVCVGRFCGLSLSPLLRVKSSLLVDVGDPRVTFGGGYHHAFSVDS